MDGVGAPRREFCSSCGRREHDGEHGPCRYDPPRFCDGCGRRLKVQVLPDGYRARCLVCGPSG